MFKKPKLQTRFFLTYLVLALFLVAIFTIIFYQYTSKILINRETDSIVTLTNNFQKQTDNSIDEMDTISININYSNLIMNKLEEYFSSESINWSDTSALTELFVALNGTDFKVDQINIYDFSGNVLGVGRSTIVDQINLSDMNWYKPTLKLNGHKYISLPYNSRSLSKTTNDIVSYMSLYRVYFNKYGRQIGIIETVQSCKNIFKDIIIYQKKNEDAPNTLVFNSQGLLIYPYSDTELSNSNYKYYYNAIEEENNHMLTNNLNTGAKELVVYSKSEYTNWTYVNIYPEEKILEPVKNLSNLLLIVVLIILIISIALSYKMAKTLNKPIKQLVQVIHETEINTLGTNQKNKITTSIDELTELNQAFHTMSSKLKSSMDEIISIREQEQLSRNIALQAQINPHFYFNSLTSIMILAENGKQKEVIELCRNLSNIMRYVTEYSSKTVPLSEEIEYVEKYFYCMKARYQSSLNFSINIDKSILDKKIPKLIIQPIIENALKYGTDCEPPWNIEIESIVKDNFWKVLIKDSGQGFSKETLENINKKIDNIEKQEKMPKLTIDGMGLINVFTRWKLHCKKNYIFEITNSDAGGACISIGRYYKNMGE